MIDGRKKAPGPGSYDVAATKPPQAPKQHYMTGSTFKTKINLEVPISHQVAVPGSGMTPVAFPSPGISSLIIGQYELAKAGDSVHPRAPLTRSVFVSKSPRFPVSLETKESKKPGYLSLNLVLVSIIHFEKITSFDRSISTYRAAGKHNI